MISNPKISVIVPLYNCIEYFPQCMDSILAQSYKDFEIIVVDDGSIDGSYELAEQYAKTNDNVVVLQQEHRFAGVARNAGMSRARGEYLIFLDSDDYFEENLLYDALTRIEETNADICAFGAKSLNNQTGIITTLRHTCMIDLCPSSGVFNRMTNPRYLFCFTTPAPWTKLFKKSFIERNGLQFQSTRSANDFCFVHTALAVAERIAVLDKHPVVYRQQNSTSLQATQHKDPEAFIRALTGLKRQLQERGLFENLFHPFVNTALDFCIYNLHTLKSNPEAHERVFKLLKNESFEEFGIAGKQRNYFYVYPQSRYDDFARIQSSTYEEYLAAPQHQKEVQPVSQLKTTLRKIIPLRASVFEKSKHDLDKELRAVKKQLDTIEEQNRDLADKLSVCLEELQKQNGSFRANER